MNNVPTMIIRNYLSSDKPQLLHIYERTWGKEKSEYIKKNWDWKYHEHPDIQGPEFPSLVLEMDGRIIGFQGAFPGRLKIGQQTYEALWLCDLMVDPDHRGRAGLRLMKKVLANHPILIGQADTGEEKDAIAYKLWNKLVNNISPNITRVPFLYKRVNIYQGVQEKIGIKPLAWIVDGIWWLFQKLLHGIYKTNINGVSIKQISRFTEKEALFLDELMRENQNIQVRDVEFMNWRYFDCPTTQYKALIAYHESIPVGYIILRNFFHERKKNGRIVDFLVKNGQVSAMKALIKEALRIFRNEDIRMVSTYGSHNEIIANVLMEFGFTTLNSPSLPILGVCPDHNFFIASDWHISFGDGDFDMD
jgi:GNAT superfamily N-acetyltransferase